MYYFSFDVESNDLFGDPIAVGWTISDKEGNEVESEGYRLNFRDYTPTPWVKENVQPSILNLAVINKNSSYVDTSLLIPFWESWIKWKQKGALLVADVAWPVEANFLLTGIKFNRDWYSNPPYPMIDVSSVLFAAGLNPVGTYDRLENEFPLHNPICDARQSVRILCRTLKAIN